MHTEIVSDSPNNSCEKMTSTHDILEACSDLTNDKIDLLQTCLLEVELLDHPNEVYCWDIINFCLHTYTANVYRDLRGVYGEIRMRGFQIYRDCMLPTIRVIFEVNTLCGLLIFTLNHAFFQISL